MRARIRSLGIVAVAAIVQLAVVVLAHDLTYLARYGSRYGEALIHSGHGDGWMPAATTSLVLAGIAVALAVARIVQLQIKLRHQRSPEAAASLYGRALLRTWLKVGPALALTTVALLTLQENVEHVALYGTSAGLGILLTPEYAGGLWIALVVGLLVGGVVALVAWRIRVLTARLKAPRPATAHRRAATAARATIVVDCPATSILGRRSALRAPPVAAPAA